MRSIFNGLEAKADLNNSLYLTHVNEQQFTGCVLSKPFPIPISFKTDNLEDVNILRT